MNFSWRLAWAICTVLVVTVAVLTVFSLFGGGLSWGTVNHFFPAVSGVTPNTNASYWGPLLLLPLAVAAGLVCGALVLDPKMSSKTESLTIIIVFIILAGVSGANFWNGDQLINVGGQMLIDILLSVAALVVVGLLTRWSPGLKTATAAQRVALFLVTVFGFLLPLYYATCLLLTRLGYSRGPGDLPAFMKFVVAALGLSAAIAPSIATRNGKPKAQKS